MTDKFNEQAQRTEQLYGKIGLFHAEHFPKLQDIVH